MRSTTDSAPRARQKRRLRTQQLTYVFLVLDEHAGVVGRAVHVVLDGAVGVWTRGALGNPLLAALHTDIHIHIHFHIHTHTHNTHTKCRRYLKSWGRDCRRRTWFSRVHVAAVWEAG